LFRSANLDTVFLAAPTSTRRRRELVAHYSTGFVYLVSRAGVTGERDSLPEDLEDLVKSMRMTTSLPVAVGFGISTPAQAAAVGRLADAVVVGSAFVRLIGREADAPGLPQKLEAMAGELSRALEKAT